MTERVLYSGFRFRHHNPGSGYDALVPEGASYVCGNNLPLGAAPETSALRRFNFLLVDLITLWKGVWYDTIHYIYPELTAFISPLLLRILGKRVVFTVHLPEYVWLKPIPSPFRLLKQASFKRSSSIITLSSDQERRYRQALRKQSVHFVPHGLTFDRARPGPNALLARGANRRIVVVGSNFRDFTMLSEIIQARDTREVSFDLIGLDDWHRKLFSNLDRVVVHSRLNSDDYDRVLSSCTAMLLPLTFATANNAMLEAYRCFLPVICSNIAGARDYALDSSMLFDDAADFWRRWDNLCARSSDDYEQYCLRLNEKAQRAFSWENVRTTVARLAYRDALGD